MTQDSKLTRRSFVRGAALLAAAPLTTLLAACGGGEAEPTEQSAQAPTTAPSPTSASGGTAAGPAASPAASPAAEAPTPTVVTGQGAKTPFKFATARQIASLTPYIALEKGYFDEEGLEVELAEIQTLGQMVPFLGTGEILAAGGALSAALFNAIRQGIEMKVVASRTALTRGFTFHGVYAAKSRYDSGEIRSIADLRGRTIANTNVEGLVAWENARILQSAGLTLNDVELVGMTPPDMPTALANGAVDAALLIEPYVVMTKRLGAGEPLVEGDGIHDLLGQDVPIGVVLASPALLEDRDLAIRFLRAHLKAARFYNEALVDPATKSEVIDIALKYLPGQDRSLYEEMIWPGIPEDGGFNPEFVDELQQFMIERGEIESALPVEDVVDLSLLEDARNSL
ncbi:ABC transporter substrate-binding protein [Sphaerobacter sp.]|uniref:ABC transporter substrate-binding protein n=1 Tax=Sphaerobacter sp. TaxID=2099654 RepID=UPI001D5C13A9|nr:ABC transporter substrate-binding protein [Sphaerobacter sp.]MBX5444447.1 ABC transporter substrate-binding protein [Sphaerobacter sp.]